MIRKAIFYFFWLLPIMLFSQDFSDLWEGHFSYNRVKDVIESDGKIYAASENAVFIYDTNSNEITELSTINGLSGDDISTIHYSEIYQLLVVGYENGLIEIVFDNEEDVFTVVDIINRPTILDQNKRINDFYEYQNYIYISTNFGISVFDLERLEFGDTYFIGDNASQIQVNQISVFQDYIYAACGGGNGVKRALITAPNLIDYRNWETPFLGSYLFMQSNEDKLITVNTNRQIYDIANGTLDQILTSSTTPRDISFRDEYLSVVTDTAVFIYDNNYTLLAEVTINEEFSTSYSSVVINNEDIFIGTENFGVLKTSILNIDTFEELHPDGPLINSTFSVKSRNNNLWVVHGAYNSSFGWVGGRRISGISHSKNEEWLNIPYDSISSKVNKPDFLSHISINPFNNDQVYISSFFSGLLEVENNEVIRIYNADNSTVLPFAADFYLTTASEYDNDGILWVMNSRVESPLNKFENGNWTSYSFSEVIDSPGSNSGFGDIVIGSDNTKWIASSNFGVIGFNENNGNPQIRFFSESENLPSKSVRALAIDRRNSLWVGTRKGLRVLFNTGDFFSANTPIEASEIIIEEDGVAKELLFEQFISDIEVDGSNNKWIATFDSGLFYLSSDGQRTLFRFTKDNSPLPTNIITDVAIDESTGEVYIATEKGLVSFRSGSSATTEDFSKSHAYPNPVRPGFNIVDDKVKIKDIPENVNIKITDIEGNLVAEAQSITNLRFNGFNLEVDGGIAYWNGKNLANNVVASGVYLILLSDLDSFETKVIKLMIVR